jgi:hypothetical protein
LLVRVIDISLGDGALAPPQVGAITDFPLTFYEPESPLSAQALPDELMTVRGVLDLDDAGPYEYRDERIGTSRWMWRGLLRGDGWTATWHGDRPLTGPVELTGYFTSSLYVDEGHVRGRITRVRIISHPYRKVDDTWEPFANRPIRYHDVDIAPQAHSDDRTLHGDNTYYRDVATLIDLDLDDVPPLTLRPLLVPGAISAVDDDALWVTDTELPLVTRLDTHSYQAVEYVLAGRMDKGRRLAATPTGCWVYGADLFRITTGEPAYQVRHGRIVDASASGETLLAYDGEKSWTLHSSTGDPIRVVLPEGDRVAIGIDCSSGDFVVVLKNGRPSDWRLQALRVTTTGQVAVGPLHRPPTVWAQRPFLAGNPLRLFYGGVVNTINSDLTFGPAVRLPRNHVDGGGLGDDIWIVTYRSSADPATPRWPLPDTDAPSSPLPRVPILTALDSSTLATESSWRLEKNWSVTAQPSTVWVTDRHRLWPLSSVGSPHRPTPVDIAALLTDSIAPATEKDQGT